MPALPSSFPEVQVQGFTLQQKIGQMLMFGWQGSTDEENFTMCEHARILIEDFHVGGLCLFGRNVQSPEQVAKMINEMQSRAEIPLLISVDQEGGMVARFKSPFAVFPGNMALGATGSVDYARRAAEAIGKQLSAVGVNMNLAPSVDVNINPDNPIIGVRSFGESPEMVGEMGSAAIGGYQSVGILACAKHFPGHGDTSTDTHHALPMIPYDRERLESVELVPFRAAAEAGVAAIMSTHIIFPALDETHPATLSEKILKGLLRDEIGYDGIVTTDCLEMKAIADNYSIDEIAVLAVNAGADILLSSHTLDFQVKLRDALIRAVESGAISEARIDQSVERILAAKRKYNLASKCAVDVDAVRKVVGSPEILALEREIAESSITIVRNQDGVIPLETDARACIAVIGMHPATERFASAFAEVSPSTRSMKMDVAPTGEQLAEMDALVKDSSAVVIVTFPKEPWTRGLVDEDAQTAVVDRIFDSGVPAIIIAAREPYALRRYPKARTSLATYGYTDASIHAADDVILGLAGPQGRLPVTIPGYAERGDSA